MNSQTLVRRGLVGVQPGERREQRQRQPGGRDIGRVGLGQDRVDEAGDAVPGGGEPGAQQPRHRADPGGGAASRELRQRQDAEERQQQSIREVPRGLLPGVSFSFIF